MSEPPQRRYFSERQGRGPKAEPLPFDRLRRMVVEALDSLREQGYFQEAFGVECVDGDRPGTLGSDPNRHLERAIVRGKVWPYWDSVQVQLDVWVAPCDEWDPDVLFDVIEVLHDLVSKGADGTYHDFGNCGWHYESFNRPEGQEDYRRELNEVLSLGDPAYKLDGHGQVVEVGEPEFDQLLDAPVPDGTEHDLITSKIDGAVSRFRARGASLDDRHHAVRDLADALEAIRRDVKESMLPADEKALFNVANGFAIRHNNRDQRGDYDRVTWLRWAFYVYLATIHAVLRVRSVADARPPKEPEA
ncbi:MAG: hypothetical protein WB507_06165 [Solirubrobacterales bacterium]